MSGSVKVSAGQVKQLREKTGVGMMDCKRALEDSGGDMERALKLLREKGLAGARKRQGRVAEQGIIESYLHIGGKIGCMVELNCETDFVARNSDFVELAHLVAMHVAATNPRCLDRESVSPELIESEKEIYRARCRQEGKPEKIWDRIVDGMLDKFYREICLLEQPFVKDPSVTVGELLAQASSRIGEKIEISRFVRMQVGEDREG